MLKTLRSWTVLLVCSAVACALAACTPTSRPQPTVPSTAAPVSPTPAALQAFDASHTVEENLVLFTELANQTIDGNQTPSSQDFGDALVRAGADPNAVELSADTTTEGKTVDAMFWSLKLGDSCLVGEYHPLEEDPTKPQVFTAVFPPVSTGCLIGSQN